MGVYIMETLKYGARKWETGQGMYDWRTRILLALAIASARWRYLGARRYEDE